jgi:hypothetical protein
MATRPASEPRSGCPINAAVEVIGDHWSPLVLRDIMFGNRRHFRVLQESSEEGIASNILADRLRRLVSAGLLTRADAGRGRRVPRGRHDRDLRGRRPPPPAPATRPPQLRFFFQRNDSHASQGL